MMLGVDCEIVAIISDQQPELRSATAIFRRQPDAQVIA